MARNLQFRSNSWIKRIRRTRTTVNTSIANIQANYTRFNTNLYSCIYNTEILKSCIKIQERKKAHRFYYPIFSGVCTEYKVSVNKNHETKVSRKNLKIPRDWCVVTWTNKKMSLFIDFRSKRKCSFPEYEYENKYQQKKTLQTWHNKLNFRILLPVFAAVGFAFCIHFV